ncbi:molybdenum cofactor biosynthesis protein B [Kangiella koreensis]|uniref:Molybdenum cofactor biosynthesis protein B n=1 Tax=Kangiella koreensis (strain DSM 16069 / JCM 12317 / KCTC 12182 / SW-125) TaxID=523791 RepID=C7RBX0_KANKD|nr:molybdenum cofactor biosynthesis protein B [Kangiella koreensis]ACV26762.1 molybdenum cofactor biosynthesis protein B [Kangiella koreensis DSM 16069]
MNSHNKQPKPFIPLNISVLTVSDTRTEETDTSGKTLIKGLTDAGHQLAGKNIVKDDIYQLRAVVSQWIADEKVQVILITGGTGFTARDNTPQAISPLLDKIVDGFGELFRHISYGDIGTSTVQSRALAGLANRTLIVCMPGSPNACRTAWYQILEEQLDNSHRPCNFVEHLEIQQADETGRLQVCETRL